MVGIYTEQYYQSSIPAEPMNGVFWPDPKQIGPFEMTDQNRNGFGINELKGHWSLMFFGYTSCPDLCPTTMAVLNEVSRQMDRTETSVDIKVIFITVDPERDTIEKTF